MVAKPIRTAPSTPGASPRAPDGQVGDAASAGSSAPGGAPQAATQTVQKDKRQMILDATLKRHQYRQDTLIEALHTAQGLYGFLTPELLWYVSRQLRLPPSKVYGVATFYEFFTLKPAGRHSLVVCQGTACYIKGAKALTGALRDAFGVRPGETTEDNHLSVLEARCLGSCGLAPAAVLDGRVLSRLTPERVVQEARAAIAGGAAPPPSTTTASEATGARA